MRVKETFIQRDGRVLGVFERDCTGGPSRYIEPEIARKVYQEGVKKVVVEYESGNRIELERM